MSTFARDTRNTVKRIPKRGHYDRETVYHLLDAALICHVGFVQNEQPFVIPTLHARDGDTLLLHGATTSRLLQAVQAGCEVCITVTHVDGLVLARSVFHHSINYRSAVVFGRGHAIEEPEAKRLALRRFTEKLLPGRWDDARQPNERELKATGVAAVPIDSASAKVRVGPPGDDDEDIPLPIWAGVLPWQTQFSPLQPAPDLPTGIPVPDYLIDYINQAPQSINDLKGDTL